MKKLYIILFLMTFVFFIVKSEEKNPNTDKKDIESAKKEAKSEGKKAYVPFKSGQIVAAQIKYEKPEIRNISKYETPLEIKGDAGWAVVVVKLNKGRSIGSYDYVLKNKGKAFPCIAVREMQGNFDAKKWQFDKTDPKKLYTMVFKVERSGFGKPKYDLHYKLTEGKEKDIPVEFQEVNQYTSPDKIPEKGIYGAVSEKIIPKVEPKKPEPEKPVLKKPEPVKPKLPNLGNKINYPSGKFESLYYSSSQVNGGGIYKALDWKDNTEWKPSNVSKQQWVWIGIPGPNQVLVKNIVIKWGNTYPKEYKLFSLESRRADAKKTLIKQINNNSGGTTTFKVNKRIGAVLIQNIGKSSNPKNKTYSIKEIEIYD